MSLVLMADGNELIGLFPVFEYTSYIISILFQFLHCEKNQLRISGENSNFPTVHYLLL